MTMNDRDTDQERRLRRAAVTRRGAPSDAEPTDAEQPVPTPTPPTEDAEGLGTQAEDEAEDAAAKRMEQQSLWVDFQIRKAMERGEFDDLPGAGKPLRLPDRHDPDWWVKRLIEREQLRGIAPPAIGLRREDAELDATLDRETREDGVRRVVEDFNRRVVEARRQLQGGPPVVTKLRDPDAEVEAWRARRASARELARIRRVEAQAKATTQAAAEAASPRELRPWLPWRRRPR